jgi:hypothetical protein
VAGGLPLPVTSAPPERARGDAMSHHDTPLSPGLSGIAGMELQAASGHLAGELSAYTRICSGRYNRRCSAWPRREARRNREALRARDAEHFAG